MLDDYTPEERDAQEHARIWAVLNAAIDAGAMHKVALELGETDDVVADWYDRMRDELDSLMSDERLDALVLLLRHDITAAAVRTLQSLQGVAHG